MMTLEEIRSLVEKAVPAAAAEGALVLEQNQSVSGQHWLRVRPDVALDVARFLRDAEELKLDFLSNVTGVDWPDKEVQEKVKVKKVVDGTEKEVDETVKRTIPGCLEVVYHLYSMEKRTGPVVLKMRTENRTDRVELPSFTPVWRGAEFQEREIFDLYGVKFSGHPDLRRIMMWDSFKDHPMRRDYVEPDDYEYEPTAHDQVLKRAEEHRAKLAAASSAEGGAAR